MPPDTQAPTEWPVHPPPPAYHRSLSIAWLQPPPPPLPGQHRPVTARGHSGQFPVTRKRPHWLSAVTWAERRAAIGRTGGRRRWAPCLLGLS